MTIQNLPQEVCLQIFTHLPISSLLQVSCVCKLFKTIAETEVLWRGASIKNKIEYIRQWKLLCKFTQSNPKKTEIKLNDVVKKIIPRGGKECTLLYEANTPENLNIETQERKQLFAYNNQPADAISNEKIFTTSSSIAGRQGNIWDLGDLTKSLYSFQCDAWDAPREPALFKDQLLLTGQYRGIKVLDLKSQNSHLIEDQHNLPFILKVHQNYLFTTAVDEDAIIKKWDIETEKCVHTFAHNALVTVLDFSQDRMLSGAQDGSLKLWNIDSGENILNLTEHQYNITSIHFISPSVALSGDRSGRVYVWNLNTGFPVSFFNEKNFMEISALCFFENTLLVAQRRTLIIYNFN